MSSEDQIRPYHAKEEAKGQEAADAVAAVLKHAAEKDKVAKTRTGPRRQPKWMLPLGINLAVLATYLLVFSPDWLVLNPVRVPDLAAQTASMQKALWFQAQRIESFKAENGRLPERFADAGTPVPGIEYVREGEGYRLVGTVGDAQVVWDSRVPNAEIEALVASSLGG